MSVFKRETSAGETAEYHFRFQQGGKLYYGVCEGCTEKDAAIAFEKTQLEIAKNLSVQKNVKALVENFRAELQGGDKIELKTAYDMALKKPRRYKSTEAQKAGKSSYWRDFISYLGKNFPDVKFLSDVRNKHAEEYIHSLRTNGRFDKKVQFKNHLKKTKKLSTYTRKEKKLSARTINVFHQSIAEVFSLLGKDAGILDNPFAEIHKTQDNSEPREAFTEKEIKLIRENWNDFIKCIFMTGFFTALREGDICTLKKNEIDFDNRIIRRKLLKTGKLVEIPIMVPLEKFLKEQIAVSGNSEYIYPEHAKMYLENCSGISYRVKSFLENLGIQTTKKVEGRDRAVSVKDVHSLRHTFCYFAGISGIPLVIVQSIVGHMNSAMTSHYSAHADRQAKHSKMLLFPDFLNQIDPAIIDVQRTLPPDFTDCAKKAIELIQAGKMATGLKKQLLGLLQR